MFSDHCDVKFSHCLIIYFHIHYQFLDNNVLYLFGKRLFQLACTYRKTIFLYHKIKRLLVLLIYVIAKNLKNGKKKLPTLISSRHS